MKVAQETQVIIYKSDKQQFDHRTHFQCKLCGKVFEKQNGVKKHYCDSPECRKILAESAREAERVRSEKVNKRRRGKLKNSQKLYMLVTSDKYELPIYIADTCQELAEYCGVKPDTIYALICLQKQGKRKFSQYQCVEV